MYSNFKILVNDETIKDVIFDGMSFQIISRKVTFEQKYFILNIIIGTIYFYMKIHIFLLQDILAVGKQCWL